MSNLSEQELIERYGNIISVTRIDYVKGVFYVTLKTEKCESVKYYTEGEFYRYEPEENNWSGHTGGFYHLDKPDLFFLDQDDDFYLNEQNDEPQTEIGKKFFEKYGHIRDIYVTSHWKYKIYFDIIVENQNEPLHESINNYDHKIRKFSTKCHKWDKLVKYLE